MLKRTTKMGRPSLGERKLESVRLPLALRAQFDELCRRKGLNKNQAYVRLVSFAILKEWLPEHIENPQLSGWDPAKGNVPPITPTLL